VKATIRSVNRFARQYNLRLVRGRGYYYWLDGNGRLADDAPSVYVFSVSHLSPERWEQEVIVAAGEVARAAAIRTL